MSASQEVAEVEDISNFCRVCLQLPEESQLLDLNLIYDEEESLSYNECFAICTHIYLTDNDRLPHNLCKSCGLELQIAYDFQKKVDISKAFLQQLQSQQQPMMLAGEEDMENTIIVKKLDTPPPTTEMTLTVEQLEPTAMEDGFEELEEHLDFDDDYHTLQESDNEATNFEAERKKCTQLNTNKIDTGCNSAENCVKLPENKFELVNVHKSVVKDMLIKTSDTKDDCTDQQQAPVNIVKARGSKRNYPAKDPSRIPASFFADPAFFPCNECGQVYAARTQLASHRHRKHRQKASFVHCDKCGKSFETRSKLEQHLKRPTCNVYPEFVCEYCSKKCIGLSNYNIHLRFHKKTYPFVCHLCAKTFMLASHLNCHVKTKHENQRYFCEEANCGKSFQTSHSLKMHAYVHAGNMPYKCEYCTRMYPTKGRLGWHISRSHGIKHTLVELDRMLVAEKLHIKAEMKPALIEATDAV